MKSKMEQGNGITFERLVEAAKNEDWDFVDGNINESHLTREQVDWVLQKGIYDEDQNVRDLAATILDRSDESLSQEEAEKVEKVMAEDSYHIVKYRLTIALYKRGYKTPIVEKMMSESKEDPDVGGLAKNFLKIR